MFDRVFIGECIRDDDLFQIKEQQEQQQYDYCYMCCDWNRCHCHCCCCYCDDFEEETETDDTEETEEGSQVNFEELKLDELKAICKEKGINTSKFTKKDDYIAALTNSEE